MPVGRFRHGNPLAGAGGLIERLRLGERLAGPFDGEEVELRRRHQRRPRSAQREQAGMVDPFAHKAEDILLRVRTRVGLDAVAHPPRQRRDIAADRGGSDARIKGRDVGGERATARVADATDLRGVDLRQRGQVIDPADPIPDPVSGQARSKEFQRVADHRVLAAAQVEARSLLRGIPELTPLALSHRVICEDDIASFHQVDVRVWYSAYALPTAECPHGLSTPATE